MSRGWITRTTAGAMAGATGAVERDGGVIHVMGIGAQCCPRMFGDDIVPAGGMGFGRDEKAQAEDQRGQ